MAFPTDETIREIVPAEFGFYPNEHVELCLYNPTDNTFISSQRIDMADGAISVIHVVYPDGTYTNYITLDFSVVNTLYPTFLIPGVFDMVINVFEDMIGSTINKKLTIDEISSDRSEVRMKYNTFVGTFERDELNNVVYKSIPKPFLGGIVDNLLVDAQQTNDPIIGVTATEVLARAKQTQSTYIAVENLHLQPNFSAVITQIMKDARDASIVSLQTADYRMIESEFQSLVTSNLIASFQKYVGMFDSNIIVT